MEVDYISETLLWYWFESWGVAVAFAVTVLLAVLAAARGGWNTGGLIIKTLMIAAVLSVMPLAMIRLGMNIAVSDEDTLGYLSLAGTAVSVVVGLLYILKTRSTARLTPGVSAAAEGSPEPPQDEPASETGDATATTDVAGAQTPEPQGPGQASAAWLVFRSGPNAGQSILLDPGATKIGRASDNDVVVDDPAVSRQHATIAFQQGRYVLEDAGSVGGTVVEGSPSALTNLTSGATIQLGGTEMVFMQSAANPIGAVSGAGQPAATMMPDQPSNVMAWLAVTAGPSKGSNVQLREGDVTIGRDQGNDLTISDAGVSRRHAMVKVEDGRVLVIDLGSSGGTKVNGEPIGGRVLPEGGTVTVGQTALTIVSVESQETPAQPTPQGATMVAGPPSGAGVVIVRSGPDSGKNFPLSSGDTLIGREPECQVLLSDPAVSRLHTLIRKQGDSFMVFDLGSRGGTRVDGNLLTGTGLANGDVVFMGNSEVVLMQPGASS